MVEFYKIVITFATNLSASKPYCPASKQKDITLKLYADLINKIPLFMDFKTVDGHNLLKKFQQLIRCSVEVPGCFKAAFKSHYFFQKQLVRLDVLLKIIKRLWLIVRKRLKPSRKTSQNVLVPFMKINVHHQPLILIQICMMMVPHVTKKRRSQYQKRKKI